VLELLIVAVCLALNALLAAFEMAFVSISRPELRGLARAGSKTAKTLIHFRERPERTLSILQVGITAVGAVAAAIGGAGASDTIEPLLLDRFPISESAAEIIAVILIVTPITALNVVVGELVPKSLAMRNPMKIALGGAPILVLADKFLAPLVQILESATKFILQIFFREHVSTGLPEPTPDIQLENLTPTHQRYILNLAQIEQRSIREIMLPWNQVTRIRCEDPVEAITKTIIESGHTRLPVFNHDKLVGILHTKEFIALREGGDADWRSIVRPVIKVSPHDSALIVMRLLQERRSHMAVVMQPGESPCGIVTLEDILEEIVGDIYDEDDDGRIRNAIATRARFRHMQNPSPGK
jgi:putative hemolysin